MEIAEILIEYGADMNAKDASGSTPLCKAAALGKSEQNKCSVVQRFQPKLNEFWSFQAMLTLSNCLFSTVEPILE